MAWENIQQRLTKAFTVEIPFPSGTVWLPESHMSIDDWLSSLAETDEELIELNIPRIRFLQNRWRIEKLIELRWEGPFDARSIWAMYVGSRAYILLWDGADYEVIAAITPRKNPDLYKAVIGRLMQNPSFIPELPTEVKNLRPDLVPDSEIRRLLYPEAECESAGDWMRPDVRRREKRSLGTYVKRLLVGWVGKWVNLPVSWYWHEPEDQNEAQPAKQNRAA